jgi:DNA-binding transcriptional MocR family regulator
VKPMLRLSFGADSSVRPRDATAIAAAIAEQLAATPAPPPAGELLLPSPRILARQLGISEKIVRAAYRLLENRALVKRKGRDVLAVARCPQPVRAKAPAPAAPKLRPLLPANRPARGTPGHITLSSAFLDPRLAPTADLAYCMRAALRSPGPSTYAHLQGYPPLRQLIARRLQPLGIEADPEHILLTVGSQQVVDLVCRSLETKRIATEDPGYAAARALFQLSDVELTSLPIDPFGAYGGVNAARWRHRLATRRPSLAYLTSSYQNPTGYSYSTLELQQILAWSEEFQFGILEDDWASDMLSPGEGRPTLRALGGDQVLYMNAFTKKTLPSLRVGYVVCNERTLPALLQSKKLSINGPPMMIEETLFEFLEQGYYDEYLRRVQVEVAARYRHCLKAMRSLLPESVRWTLPGGGPLLWLELPRQVSLEAVIEELARRQVLVSPPAPAFASTPHLHGFMIGYAFPDRSEMTTAIELLADVLKKQLATS